MEVTFFENADGIRVKCGRSVLAGVFTTLLHAQKAAEAYLSLNKRVTKERASKRTKNKKK